LSRRDGGTKRGRERAHLQLGKGVRVIGEAEGVKRAARVQRVGDLASRATVDAVALRQAQQNHLVAGSRAQQPISQAVRFERTHPNQEVPAKSTTDSKQLDQLVRT
jgi:hypothetical protein